MMRVKMTRVNTDCALAVVLLLSGLLPGCALEEKCGFDGCPGDAKIKANVQASINRYPEVGPRVYVQTLNHVVYLSGFVSAGEMKDIAEQAARQTPGVTHVVNSIAVTF
jgi:osmotically-inducible protein OsmY